MKEGRKPEYLEKTPDDQLQKFPDFQRSVQMSREYVQDDKFQSNERNVIVLSHLCSVETQVYII